MAYSIWEIWAYQHKAIEFAFCSEKELAEKYAEKVRAENPHIDKVTVFECVVCENEDDLERFAG